MTERQQPIVKGLNNKGELVWGFIDMARWQMEMFRLSPDWFGEFFTRWLEVANLESKGEDFRTEDAGLCTIKAASKKRLAEMRRMYPPKKVERLL